MAERIIETLTAEAGRQWEEKKEAIGTYGRASIVFLPRGVQPGERIRVEIEEIRPDARGRMMYRGKPAPSEQKEVWRDNGDGSVSRIVSSVDWKLQETETGVAETRPLAKREGTPSERSSSTVVWGTDQASSFIEEQPVRAFPLEEEHISSESISWWKVGERVEQLPAIRHPMGQIVVRGGTIWDGQWSNPVFKADWTLRLETGWSAPPPQWSATSFRAEYAWGSLPAWYQAEILTKFPLCPCGRQRRNTTVASDGFAQCETCRKETPCQECGSKGIVAIGSRLVCATCKPFVEQEALVERCVPMAHREELALQALELLDGECVPREAGEIILRSSLGHFSDRGRDALLEKWSGFPRYYFTPSGVYGSKLGSPALQILCHLASASGRGLVELVAWLAGDVKGEGPDDGYSSPDFYQRTQEKGESRTPALTEESLRRLTVATRLRGSEADRVKAVEGYNALLARPEAKEFEREVAAVLFSDEQDYAATLAKITEVEVELARRSEDVAAGRALFGFEAWHRRGGMSGNGDGWVVRPDGSLREPDERDVPRHKHDGTYRWRVVAAGELALRWSCGSRRDVSGSSSFEVAKRPADELTPAQIEAVRAIEAEIGAPEGAFGLNAEMRVRFDARLTAAHSALRRSQIVRRLPENAEYRVLAGENGVQVWGEDLYAPEDRCVNWSRPFEEYCDGRGAQLLERFPAADGEVDVLAYEKYGKTNIAVRWCKTDVAQPSGAPTATPTPAASPETKPADLSKVDLSQLFGGGRIKKR